MGTSLNHATGVTQKLALRGPVDTATLREIVRRFVAARPDSVIILFGSRARGQHRLDSDVDLLVVTQCDESPTRIAGELYAEIADRDFGVDLVVITPEQLRERRSRFDPFMREVMIEGRVLHGSLD